MHGPDILALAQFLQSKHTHMHCLLCKKYNSPDNSVRGRQHYVVLVWWIMNLLCTSLHNPPRNGSFRRKYY